MPHPAWNYPWRVSCSDPLSGEGFTARQATNNLELRLLRSLGGWDITSLGVGLTFATLLSIENAAVANDARPGPMDAVARHHAFPVWRDDAGRNHIFRLLTSVDEEQHHLLLAFCLPVDLKVRGWRATRMFFC